MGRSPHACVTSQLMGKEAAHAFPVKRNNRRRRCSFTLCAFSNLGTVVPSSFLLKLLLSLAAAASSLCFILHLLQPPWHPELAKAKEWPRTLGDGAAGERVGGTADVARLLSHDGRRGPPPGQLEAPLGVQDGGR